MAQQMKARVNLLLKDISGTTIDTATLKKVYMDTAGDWQLAGDAGPDDPGTAVSITLTQGAQSDIDSNYYNYYGDIVTSYTYSLYIDVGAGEVLQAGFTGQMLFGMDLAQYIAANHTHVIGDGSDHANVALNDAHRVNTSNPHSTTKTHVVLGNVSNLSPANQVSTGLTKQMVIDTALDVGDLADTGDLLASASDIVEELADGSEEAVTVLKTLFNMMMNNEKFASMMAYAGYYSTYAGDPTGNVTPNRLLQMCFDSVNDDVYISIGLTSADWVEITVS